VEVIDILDMERCDHYTCTFLQFVILFRQLSDRVKYCLPLLSALRLHSCLQIHFTGLSEKKMTNGTTNGNASSKTFRDDVRVLATVLDRTYYTDLNHDLHVHCSNPNP